MNTYVLVYDGFAQFEVIFACLFMKRKGEIIVVGIDDKEVKSIEGFIIKPTQQLKNLNIDDIDLFIIPGGEAKNIYNNSYLDELLNILNIKKKVIAAICCYWQVLLEKFRQTILLRFFHFLFAKI